MLGLKVCHHIWPKGLFNFYCLYLCVYAILCDEHLCVCVCVWVLEEAKLWCLIPLKQELQVFVSQKLQSEVTLEG